MRLPVRPAFIPSSFETERLLIRAPRRGDGAEMCAAVLETMEDLRPWMPWAQQSPNPADSEEKARMAARAYAEGIDMQLRLFRKDTGELVGSSGLHSIDWSVPRFEIGYWCRRRFQGMGYVTEAVRGITRFAFGTLKAERVEIRCDSRNERSWRVARRAGYTLEAVLHSYERAVDGALRDTMVFALTRADYSALRPAVEGTEEAA